MSKIRLKDRVVTMTGGGKSPRSTSGFYASTSNAVASVGNATIFQSMGGIKGTGIYQKFSGPAQRSYSSKTLRPR